MSDLALARRYAKALLGIADAGDAIETVQAELDGADQALSDGEAQSLLTGPTVPPRAKLAAIRELAERAGLSDVTRHFLCRLIEARRIDALGDICAAYRTLARERGGIIEAQVTSANPLSDAQSSAVQQALEAKTGKSVIMKVDVDPALVAGVRIRIDNLVLDGSAQGRLRVLGERLVKGRVHEH